MPTKTYTLRQDHGTRGTTRDRYRDPYWGESRLSLEPQVHLMATLAELGIKTGRPTTSFLDRATTLESYTVENEFDRIIAFELAMDQELNAWYLKSLEENRGGQQAPVFSTESCFYSCHTNKTMVEVVAAPEEMEEEDFDPNEAHLPTGAALGIPNAYQSRRPKGGTQYEDLDYDPEDDYLNGGDRTFSGFSFRTRP